MSTRILYRPKTTAPAKARTNIKVVTGRRLTNANGFIAAILFDSPRLCSASLGQGTAVSMRGIQIWEAIQLCSTSEEGNGALRSSDWVVIDRKQVWASEARWSDVHEGSRAHDLGIGEAQF